MTATSRIMKGLKIVQNGACSPLLTICVTARRAPLRSIVKPLPRPSTKPIASAIQRWLPCSEVTVGSERKPA